MPLILTLRHVGHCCSSQRLPKEIARHWDWSGTEQFASCFERLCQVSCDIPWITTKLPKFSHGETAACKSQAFSNFWAKQICEIKVI